MRPMCHVFVPIIITAIIKPALIEAKFERLRDHLICHIISSLGACRWLLLLCVEFKINSWLNINHGPYLCWFHALANESSTGLAAALSTQRASQQIF